MNFYIVPVVNFQHSTSGAFFLNGVQGFSVFVSMSVFVCVCVCARAHVLMTDFVVYYLIYFSYKGCIVLLLQPIVYK